MIGNKYVYECNQNLLKTDKTRVFRKVYFLAGLLLILYQNGLEPDKAVDVTSEKVVVISKVHYFDLLVSCLDTFIPLSLTLKWVTTSVPTT